MMKKIEIIPKHFLGISLMFNSWIRLRLPAISLHQDRASGAGQPGFNPHRTKAILIRG